jgi:hypothetical protein
MPRPRLSSRPPPPARASPRDAPIRSQPTFRAAVANAADHHAPLDGAPRRSTSPVDHSRAEKPARAAERPPALALTQAAAPTSCPNAPSTTGACNGHTALHSLRRTSPHTRIDLDAHQLADATTTPNRPHAAELSVARHLYPTDTLEPLATPSPTAHHLLHGRRAWELSCSCGGTTGGAGGGATGRGISRGRGASKDAMRNSRPEHPVRGFGRRERRAGPKLGGAVGRDDDSRHEA